MSAWIYQDEDPERLLGNMLAIMCGDGGHYQGIHGTQQAVMFAISRFYNLLECEEALKRKAIPESGE